MGKIKFNNRQNPEHTINGKIVWESRSVAVVAVVFAKFKGDVYVLMEKRSNRMDQPGKWCLPCGYLDWDENGWQAVTREIYEETSMFLPNYDESLLSRNKRKPFFINTEVSENRQNVALSYGMVFDFKTVLPQEILHYANPEIDTACWIKLNDINGLDVAFEHDRRILQAKEYFKNYLFPWYRRLIKRIF
jgi:8-oxo-dGTP pyrophosphatase MutT (NUDIX family)